MIQVMPSLLPKSRGCVSLNAHRRFNFANWSRTTACYNMPSAAMNVGQDAKMIQPLTIAHREHKTNLVSGKEDNTHSVSAFEEGCLEEMSKRIEELVAEIKGLFNSMGDGEISPSAYDTAWVARISTVDGTGKPQFPQLLNWIIQNQLPDGSWGESPRFLACDRLLSTLSCILTLAIWDVANDQLKRGVEFIRRNTEGMVKEALAHHRANGFEMVFPTLLNEAKLLGLDLPYEISIMEQISQKRDSLLERVSVEELHRCPSRVLQCVEGIQEVIDWKKILKVQSKDGSFSGSPASTACVFMHTRDEKSLRFLTSLVTKFGDHVPAMYPVDLLERLRAVDCVERLGLERHFQNEIKQALDYVFLYWNERGIGVARESLVPDIDLTATAFRLLRIFGYSVSSEVLQSIKSNAEELLPQYGNENSAGVVTMLSLYRSSQHNFPGEKVMKGIDDITKPYLAEFLQREKFTQAKAVNENLPQEVEYALSARWNRNLPRLMSRNQIELFSSDDLWLEKTLYKLPNANNDKHSELAKLDFNRIQAIHRSEIKHIKRWYKDCNFPRLDFPRHRELAVYWTSSVVMFEPQYTDCRLDYTKAGLLGTIIDDLYETSATMEQIKLFNEAFQRWDPLRIEELAEDIKIVFMGLYNTLIDISDRARKVQGRDLLPYLHKKWLNLLTSFTQEREWYERNYSPSLDEYWQNAVVSVALETTMLTPIFSMGDVLPDRILQKLDFLNLVSQTGRLVNDVRTSQSERGRGEMASFVQCYVNDHPGCPEEEALNYLEGVNEDALTNLNYNFLMRTDIPKHYRTLAFNTARIMQLVYSKEDGFRNAAEVLEDLIKKSLFEPLF